MFSDIYSRLLRSLIAQENNLPNSINRIDVQPLDEIVRQSNSISEFSNLIQSAYQKNPNSNIGLRFGQQVNPFHACESSRMLTTAPTVEHFFKLLIRQYHRLGLKPFPMYFEDKYSINIALTYPYFPVFNQNQNESDQATFNRFCTETFYSYCVNVIRNFVDEGINPTYVAFDFSDPGYKTQYEEFFNCPIGYDSVISTIQFDKSLLQQPMKGYSEHLHQVYKERFDESWQHFRRRQSFRYRSVILMMLNAPECFQIANLADKLNISVRGLQKRLKNEQCSFSELTLQVRRELLKVCLVQSNISLEDSTHLLGFQTQTSLKRFFRDSMESKDAVV